MIFTDEIARWLDSADGATTARDMARAVFERGDDLAAFEIGEARYPTAIERELDRLIAEREEQDA